LVRMGRVGDVYTVRGGSTWSRP